MPEELTDDEQKLLKLGQRLREGWAKLHPVSEETIEKVRDVIVAQWNEEQQLANTQIQPKNKKNAQSQSESEQQQKSPKKSKGQEYGQRH